MTRQAHSCQAQTAANLGRSQQEARGALRACALVPERDTQIQVYSKNNQEQLFPVINTSGKLMCSGR